MRCWMPSSIIPFATMCAAADAAPSIFWAPAFGARPCFGGSQTSGRKTWAPGCGAGAGPAFCREKAEAGVNADVTKLSRKVRLVCHAFMKEAWINRPFAAKPKVAGKPAAFSCSYAEKPVDHSVDRLVGVSFQKRYFRKYRKFNFQGVINMEILLKGFVFIVPFRYLSKPLSTSLC